MPREAKPRGKKEQPAAQPAAEKPPARTRTSRPKASAAKPAAKAPSTTRRATSRRPAEKRLAPVPEQYVFYCCDGSVFRDLEDLVEGLEAMSDEAFAYHSNLEKRDFANWVRDVIEDIELANDLAMAASRRQAADCVADRIALLVD